jgi:hypothetical protein
MCVPVESAGSPGEMLKIKFIWSVLAGAFIFAHGNKK